MYYVVRAERKSVARYGLQGVRNNEICHIKRPNETCLP